VSKETQSVSGTVSDQRPTSAGNPIAHNQNSLTAGPRRPLLHNQGAVAPSTTREIRSPLAATCFRALSPPSRFSWYAAVNLSHSASGVSMNSES
jgi:hypothetical protein